MPKHKRSKTRRVTHHTKHHVKYSKSWTKKYLFTFVSVTFVVAMMFVVTHKKSSGYVLGVATQSFRSAIVNWISVPGAVSYNIYYKTQNDKQYIHSVMNIPPTMTTYTINYLKKSTVYEYYISAVDASGKEFWFSPMKWIWNFQ